MGKFIYVAVTTDKYEFIRYLEDSVPDLSKALNISEGCIYKSMKRGSITKANGEKLRIIKISLDDSD